MDIFFRGTTEHSRGTIKQSRGSTKQSRDTTDILKYCPISLGKLSFRHLLCPLAASDAIVAFIFV